MGISYIDDDGVEHTRILFNIEGSRGRGRVWADKSDAHTSGQFYYLIVQDVRTEELWAIIDNRPKTPEAQRNEEVAALLSKRGLSSTAPVGASSPGTNLRCSAPTPPNCWTSS